MSWWNPLSWNAEGARLDAEGIWGGAPRRPAPAPSWAAGKREAARPAALAAIGAGVTDPDLAELLARGVRGPFKGW